MIGYQFQYSIKYLLGPRWYADPAPIQFPLDSDMQVCYDERIDGVVNDKRWFIRNRLNCEWHLGVSRMWRHIEPVLGS